MSLALPSETRLEFLSESAYDALRDGMSLVVRLFRSPRTLAELEAEWPDVIQLRRLLDRLERSGIIRKDGERYVAAAGVMQSRRQEGMVSALSQFFLPTLTRLVQDPNSGLLLPLELSLSEEEQQGLRHGPIEALFDELIQLTEEPTPTSEALRLIIFGTANPPQSEDPVDRVFEVLRRTARDRTLSDVRERTVFTMADGSYPSMKVAAGALLHFADRMREFVVPSNSATYSLVLGLTAQPRFEGVNA